MMIDRHGSRPVLIPSAFVHIAGFAGLVAWTELHGATLAVLLFPIPIGLSEPPVSAR
jgi:hypothetical protein